MALPNGLGILLARPPSSQAWGPKLTSHGVQPLLKGAKSSAAREP